MGWADCGTDSRGRPIGYAFEAWCDAKDCTEKIDRGLSYACGGMHGEDEISCEGYFCTRHLTAFVVDNSGTREVCATCAEILLAPEEGFDPIWIEDDDGTIIPFDPACRAALDQLPADPGSGDKKAPEGAVLSAADKPSHGAEDEGQHDGEDVREAHKLPGDRGRCDESVKNSPVLPTANITSGGGEDQGEDDGENSDVVHTLMLPPEPSGNL